MTIGLGTKNPDRPVSICEIATEVHYQDKPSRTDSDLIRKYTYFDGFSEEVQIKQENELGSVNKRWRADGWKILDNKGNPFKTFEPFLSPTKAFEKEILQGKFVLEQYDPLNRPTAKVFPNGTFEKVQYRSWYTTHWDANDNVLSNPKDELDISYHLAPNYKSWLERIFPDLSDLNNLPQNTQLEITGVNTLSHQDTPLVKVMDVFGNPFKEFKHNGTFSNKIVTVRTMDVNGFETGVVDPRGIQVVDKRLSLQGETTISKHADAGQLHSLTNFQGDNVLYLDANKNLITNKYDELNRLKERWVNKDSNGDLLKERVEYGENSVNAPVHNLRTRIHKSYDESGLVTNNQFDFKGNLTEMTKQLPKLTTAELNWNTGHFFDRSRMDQLATEQFISNSTWDALDRVVISKSPDLSQNTFNYHKSNQIAGITFQSPQIPQKKVVNEISYNAKYQTEKVKYANGLILSYTYDKENFQGQ